MNQNQPEAEKWLKKNLSALLDFLFCFEEKSSLDFAGSSSSRMNIQSHQSLIIQGKANFSIIATSATAALISRFIIIPFW